MTDQVYSFTAVDLFNWYARVNGLSTYKDVVDLLTLLDLGNALKQTGGPQ